jgi:hypothetical protein
MTDDQRGLALALKRSVTQRAYQLGIPGSPEYLAAFRSGLDKLRNQRDKLEDAVATGFGRQIVSVAAGENVTWSAPMNLSEQLGAYVQAIEELEGRTFLATRTTARFIY